MATRRRESQLGPAMLIVRIARRKLITGLAHTALFIVCLVGLFVLKPLWDSMTHVDLSRPSPFRNRSPST
jgi:hypothetical protein